MDFKNTKASNTTITLDRNRLMEDVDNIYAAINVIGKRSNQINEELRTELHRKLDEFATQNDSLEEIFENKEQIEVSKFYESLPKPTSYAVDEFLDGRTYHRLTEDEES